MRWYVWGVRVGVCVGVFWCMWDEFSEYLLETRVLTSTDFNRDPIRIFFAPFIGLRRCVWQLCKIYFLRLLLGFLFQLVNKVVDVKALKGQSFLRVIKFLLPSFLSFMVSAFIWFIHLTFFLPFWVSFLLILKKMIEILFQNVQLNQCKY